MGEVRIEPLSASHELGTFDCGKPPLNSFLRMHARSNMERGVSRIWVATTSGNNRVMAYSALSTGSFQRVQLPMDDQIGLPRYPLPSVHLGRLAVDLTCRGQRLGESLLFHFLRQAIEVAERVGVYAVDLYSKDEEAKRFYLRYLFIPFQDDPLHLYIPLPTVRAMFAPGPKRRVDWSVLRGAPPSGTPAMPYSAADADACRTLLRLALAEDLAAAGDLTSLAVVPAELSGAAAFVARSPGVLAGVDAARLTFAAVDPSVEFETHLQDGAKLAKGSRIATVRGPMRSILTGERTALNFLQRLCGVATQTARYAEKVAGLPVKLLDTRKTTPGWRLLEKHAVRMGGGTNHRMGLHDGILVKDNHLAGLGIVDRRLQIEEAVRRAREKFPGVPVEVEVDTLEQLDTALAMAPEIVLLDNMGPDLLREAVKRRDALAPAVKLEASGGVTLDTLRAIAETGVDRVSVGALTHSAVALDIGLDYGS